MLSKSQIAKNWRTSHQYVSQCVAKGCPLTSYEDANQWRAAHASKRPPTNPGQIARQVSESADDDSPEARARRKKYFEDKPDGFPIPSKDPMDDTLRNSRYAAAEAFRLLAESMAEQRDSKISVRLGIHNKATEGYFRAEQAHREELERRRVLIPLSEAEDWTRKAFDVILSRLAALPQNLALRCNPSNPHTAMDALQEECTAIVADAQKVFA
jgi:hypothetical protein